MKNDFKKLFLLPSLLLTQAYCLEQHVELHNNTNVDKYSEKIKIFSEDIGVENAIVKSENIVPPVQKISQIELILFGLISATLSALFLKNNSQIKFQLCNFLEINKITTHFNLQKKVFNFIKSIKKTFHSKFQKIYFYSFIA